MPANIFEVTRIPTYISISNKAIFIMDIFLLFRKFDASSVLPPELVVLHEDVHKRVFMTYLRMSTHKESKARPFDRETVLTTKAQQKIALGHWFSLDLK